MRIAPTTLPNTVKLPLLVVLLSTACAPRATQRDQDLEPAVQVRIVDGAFHSVPDQAKNVACPIFDVKREAVRITSSRNEVTGFFAIVTAPSGLQDVRIVADPLQGGSGSLDSSHFQLFRVWYASLDEPQGWVIKSVPSAQRPSEIPDVLIPINAPRLGQPYALSNDQKLVLWIDLAVPPNTTPGEYRSALNITSGEQSVASIPIDLTVLPYVLPDENGVALLAPMDMNKLLGHHLQVAGEPYAPFRVTPDTPLYEESLGLVKRSLELLQRHRLNPYLTGLYPVCKTSLDGELEVDWQGYDQLIATSINGDVHTNVPAIKYWPVPMDAEFPPPPAYDPLTSPTYTRELRQYLTHCVDHFVEQGWIDKAFLLPPIESGYSEDAFNRTRRYAGIARLASDRIRIVSTLPPQDLGPYGWLNYPYSDLSGYVDIWCPQAQFYDPSVFIQPKLRQQDKWFSLDRPPYSGTTNLWALDTYTRSIPMQAARLGATAVLLDELNNWTEDLGNTHPADQIRQHPTPLLMPGRFCGMDTPIPTIRLKMLRRGMQDLAYLQLCRMKGLHTIVETTLRALCPYPAAQSTRSHIADGRHDSWLQDPTWWNYARLLSIQALKETGASDIAEDHLLESVHWQRFLDAATPIRLLHEGTRVSRHVDARDPELLRFDVEILLRLENRGPKSAPCAVHFGTLPLGWSIKSESGQPETLFAYDDRQIILRAVTNNIAAGASTGHMTVPVIVDIEDVGSFEHAIPLSHVLVPSRQIHLDGDLADWPIGNGNVASVLEPVTEWTARDSSERSQDPDDVIAMVTSDKDYLYFGVHCLTTAPHESSPVQSNFIEYDDYAPVGEEILEIMIDPTNGRSDAPGDLYHIVIKPSGSVLEEAGVSGYPPIGHALEWSGHTRVVTRQLKDRWVAELRIPFRAFGPSANRQDTWGLNICRYLASRQQHRCWSPVRWHAYSPKNLGNMSFVN